MTTTTTQTPEHVAADQAALEEARREARAETTVSLETDGRRTAPIPLDEFNERVEQGLDRLGRQLSFNVGGKEPTYASIGIGGSLATSTALEKGAKVTVQVTDESGEIVAHAKGHVVMVAFKDSRAGDLVICERVHKVQVS